MAVSLVHGSLWLVHGSVFMPGDLEAEQDPDKAPTESPINSYDVSSGYVHTSVHPSMYLGYICARPFMCLACVG